MLDGGPELRVRSAGVAVGATLRRLPLEAATRVALALTLLLVVGGSSGVRAFADVATPLRWVALASFAALALLWAVAEEAGPVALVRVGGAGIGLAFLGLLSTAWSVFPMYTLERDIAFSVVAVAVAAAAAATRGRVERAEALAETIVATTALICVAGAVVYAFDPGVAAEAAQPGYPFRFSGLGESPNTVPLLAVLAACLAGWLALRFRGRGRLGSLAALAVFAGQIITSGSRGAAIGLGVGSLALAVLAPAHRRGRVLVVIGAIVFSGGVIAANRVMQNATQLPLPPVASPAASAAKPGKAGKPEIVLLPFDEELGGTPVGARTFFGHDGRALALQEAFDQGSQRPIVGWGFGTEPRVFTERVENFQSLRAENSYLGLYLEDGVAGVVLWLLSGVAVLLAVFRVRRRDVRTRLAVAGAAALVAAGFALGISQSYVYSAGDVATLSYWLFAALAAALALGSAPWRSARGRLLAAIVAVLAVAAVPVGLWESGHARSVQNSGIEGVWRRVGSRIDTPALDGFRVAPPLECLLYRAGGSPAGYELCFDDGRLVEAFDRRYKQFHVWTVQVFGADAAAVRVPAAVVHSRLVSLGAFRPGIKLQYGYAVGP